MELEVNGVSEHILRAAMANADAAMTVFTADRRFIAVSDRYVELTGYTRDEALALVPGASLRLHPLDHDQFADLVASEVSVGEADILTKRGEPLAVEYVVIPTEVDGERVFIGVMWPLVAGEGGLLIPDELRA